MNNERRQELGKLATRADELKTMLEELREEVESIQSEEQDYFDNMPESFQGGDKGERAQAAIDAMQTIYDALDNAVSELDGLDFDAATE